MRAFRTVFIAFLLGVLRRRHIAYRRARHVHRPITRSGNLDDHVLGAPNLGREILHLIGPADSATLIVPGVNNLKKFGRWGAAEFTAVYEIEAEFTKLVASICGAEAA